MMKRIIVLFMLLIAALFPCCIHAEGVPDFLISVDHLEAVWPSELVAGELPTPQIVYHNELLVEGEDYTLIDYHNDQYNLVGKGSFTGTRLITAPRLGRQLTEAPKVSAQNYNGAPIVPENSTYTVQAWNNILPGTATARFIANGENGYYGAVTTNFDIRQYAPSVKMDVSGTYSATQGAYVSIDDQGLIYLSVYKNGKLIASGNTYIGYSIGLDTSTWEPGVYDFKFTRHTFQYVVANVNGVSQYTKRSTGVSGYSNATLTLLAPPSASEVSPVSLVPGLPADAGASKTYVTLSAQPENATIHADEVVFSTSDPSVATVSGYGEITIHQAGSVVITAEYRGKTAIWDMTFDPLSIENAVFAAYSPADNTATLLYRGQLLAQDTDYTIAYEETRENVRLVTITGAGTFGGSISKAFYVDTGYPLSDDEDLLVPSVPRQFDFDGTTLVANIGPASDIVIPYGVTAIAERAFSGRQAPQTVTVPETVTQLGYRAFSGCSAHTIHLPNTLTSIGDYAFTSSDITSLSIPESVTSIGSYAFSFCDSLTEIDLPDSITSLGDNTFEYCDALTSVILPDNLTALGKETFYDCGALERVTLPSSLKDLGSYTFYNCRALKEIELPDTLTTIGSDVFSFCESLCELTFPAGVSYVESAFSYCGSPRIYLNDTLAYTTGISNGKLDEYTFSLYSGILVATPGSRTEASLKALSIPYATPENPDYALQAAADGTVTLVHAAKDLVNATIPSSVTAIASDAFSGCGMMKTLLLPDHITSLNDLPNAWDPETGLYSAILCNIGSQTSKAVSEYGSSFCPPSMPYLELSYYSDRLYADGLREPVTDLVLPEGIQELSSNAFKNQTELVSVTLPTSIERIGSSAFYNCTSLKEIKGLENVTTIDSYAFSHCDSFKSIVIPDSLTTITRYSFTNCSAMLLCAPGSAVSLLLSNNGYFFADPSQPQVKLNYGSSGNLCAAGAAADATEITIPDGVTEIAYRAFYYHSTLERIVIPESVTSIGGNAFYGCFNLQAVILPENLTNISSRDTDKLFCSRESLTAMTLSSKNYSFRDPDYPQVCILAREDENGARTYTVADCSEDAVSVALPEGTTTIASNAFYNCKQLESITLPESLTMIESDAFKNCTALTSLVLPDSITSIASGVLKGKTLYINPESSTGETVAAAGYAFRFRSGYEGLNFVLEAAEDGTRSLTLKSADPALTSIPALPPQTRAIASRAFYRSAATDITLPEGLLTIGDYAFSESKSLTNIVIPDSVTEIGSHAFYYCSALESVALPENLTAIGEFLFYQCPKLASVDIPGSVTIVGKNAFQYCSALESITLPENLITIDHYAFYGCDLLTEIHLPETVTSIGNYAFCCESLTKINIPASVTSIGDGTFSYCSALESLVLPEGITSIGTKAFHGCYNLKVSIPESLTSAGSELGGTLLCAIDSSAAKTLSKSGNKFTDPAYPALKLYYNSDASVLALYDCSSSAEGAIIVPDAVTKLDRYAFYYDTHITSVTLPDNITSIDSRWFYECSFSIHYRLDSQTAIALTKAGMPKYAYDGLTIETKQNTDGTLTITVTGAKTDLTEVIIPQGVTAIGANAFKDHTALRSVSIPDSVTSIASSFFGCTALEDVTLPQGLTAISAFAFSGCSVLKTIALPDSIVSIGSEAFRNCIALESIEIPANVTSIGSGAFDNCKMLTEVVLPEGLTALSASAFEECAMLASVTLPKTLTSIGEEAFYKCSALKAITLPDGITTVGSRAFGNCPATLYCAIDSDTGVALSRAGNRFTLPGYEILSLKAENSSTEKPWVTITACSTNAVNVTIPNGVTHIGSSSFSGCTQLESISLPGSIVSIGGSAFYNCKTLQSLTLPDSVTSIGTQAFYNCSSLQSLTLPDSISSIGDYTFQNCTALQSITLPNSVTIIGKQAFYNCTALQSITLPDGISSISDYTFYKCTALQSIILPDGITSIGSNAFTDCPAKLFCDLDSETALTLSNAGRIFSDPEYPQFSFKAALNENSARVFTLAGCDKSADEIVVPDFVTAIGSNAFNGCASLTSITLPDGITSVGSNAFSGCPAEVYCTMNSDTALALGKTSYSFTVKGAEKLVLRTIEDKNGKRITCVYDCDSDAVNVVIPDGVEQIQGSCFAYCSSLASVTIPNSVTSIGSYAFRNCFALQSITLPNSITSIGSYAFQSCTALQSITLPDSITSISDYTFYNCTALQSIILPDVITSIGSYAFSNCTALKSIDLPDGITSIDSNAFTDCPAKFFCNLNSETALTLSNAGHVFTAPEYPQLSFKVALDDSGSRTFTLADCDKSATEVIVPDFVTAIGNAFYECDSLTSIVLPDGITSVGSNAFSGCPAEVYCTMNSDTALALGKTSYSFTVKGAEKLVLRTIEDKNGKRITCVYDCDSDAVNVVIPDGVEQIQGSCFAYCSSLASVTIPNSVTSIGSYAFRNCFALQSITLPDNITSIGEDAFYNCTSLQSITLPDNITSIGEDAFYNCTSLQSITLPDGITALPSSLFSDCTTLEEVVIPDSITSIGSYVFSNCTALQSIDLPDGITSIGRNAFSNCPAKIVCALDSETALTLSKVGCAFTDPAYPLLSFKAALDDSGSRIFTLDNCDKSATEIIVPDFVTAIGNAFYECTSLTSITLPDSITSVGSSAFTYCPAEIYCTMNSDTALALGKNSRSFTVKGSEMLRLLTYEDENGKRITCVYRCDSDAVNVVIPDGVEQIGRNYNGSSYGFRDCASLVSVTIPDSVKWIENQAFYRCSSLATVIFSKNLDSIGTEAFRDCTSLRSVTLPDNITSVGRNAFYDCPAKLFCNLGSETALTLSNAGYAFTVSAYPLLSFRTALDDSGSRIFTLAGCDKSATEIIVPDFVTAIGANAFYDCALLESITLPERITSVSSSAFSNCPASIYCAMNSDTALALGKNSRSFTVKGSEMLALRTYEDENGKRITYVHNCDRDAVDAIIPDGVEQISRSGYEAGFANCTSLVSVTIPDSVKKIENHAFYRCTSLTSVTLPEGLESIGESAFDACAALTSITIPKTLSSLGRYAFSNCTSLTSIILPDDITSIASEAFSSSSATRFCAVNSATALALGKAGYTFIDPAYPLLSFKVTLDDDGSRTITLTRCDKSVTEIVIPDFVTAIGSWAFSGCASLTSITLPDSITFVGNSVFSECPASIYCTMGSDTALALGKAGYTFIDPAYPLLSFKVTLDDDGSRTITLTRCDKSATEITVPEGVTAIGYQAFYNCTSLEDVALPDTLTSIGGYAFSDCSALASLSMPESVVSIGNRSFDNCPVTHSYSKDSSVALALGQAGYTFIDPAYPQFSLKVTLDDAGERMITLNRCNKDVTEVTVPEFIDAIGNGAFQNCTALESVSLPDGLRAIGSSAFYECDSLTAITIPNSVTEIGSSAFQYCDWLETVSLPDGLTHLSSSIFYSCDSLKSLTLPQTLVSIDRYAFFYSGLERITLPPSLESIAYWAFTGCNLAELSIPPSVKTIPEIIVDSGLKRVFLPAEVTEICTNAFGSGLKTVYGYADSAAEAWAQTQGCAFIAVDAAPPEEYTTFTGPSELHMDTGMTLDLREKLTINPQLPVLRYTISCISSDPSVVQADGASLTFLSAGSAELTVSIAEIPALSLTIPVSVYPPVEDFSIPSYIFLKSGRSMDLYPQEITPEDAYRTFTFAYDGRRSTAEKLTLYNYSASSGAFPLTVTSLSGISRTATVVRYKEITDVQISTPRVMQIGDTAIPEITVFFDDLAIDSTDALTELASSNPDVIRVTGGRQLEALSAGYARISATAPDDSEVAFNVVVDPATSFMLPTATKVIRDEAFCGLPVQAIMIPDGCVQIGARAFAGCSNLVSVRIPASVTSIDSDAFSGCNHLIVYTPAGSAASIYAQENGLTVIEY